MALYCTFMISIQLYHLLEPILQNSVDRDFIFAYFIPVLDCSGFWSNFQQHHHKIPQPGVVSHNLILPYLNRLIHCDFFGFFVRPEKDLTSYIKNEI